MVFEDREDAGRQLARVLRNYRRQPVVVLALPKGGVVPAAIVAGELDAPLGLILVRKIGHPAYPEYAIGAVAEDQEPVLNENEIVGVSELWLQQAVTEARKVINERRRLYFNDELKPPLIRGKIAIIIDDGIATGLTMEAAIRAVRSQHPKQIVVAVPVASLESLSQIQDIADIVMVLDDPGRFLGAVGAHYMRFEQVDDDEVTSLLWDVNEEVASH